MSSKQKTCHLVTSRVCGDINDYPDYFVNYIRNATEAVKWYCSWGYTKWMCKDCDDFGNGILVFKQTSTVTDNSWTLCPACEDCETCAVYLNDTSSCGPDEDLMLQRPGSAFLVLWIFAAFILLFWIIASIATGFLSKLYYRTCYKISCHIRPSGGGAVSPTVIFNNHTRTVTLSDEPVSRPQLPPERDPSEAIASQYSIDLPPPYSTQVPDDQKQSPLPPSYEDAIRN